MLRQTGFFPGFIDSDGRPWDRSPGGSQNYERGLESALKIALLTHRHLFLPAGYLLDNPHLQRIFLRYKGENTEAKCFRALMRDLFRISIGDNLGVHPAALDDWTPILREWVGGQGSNRGKRVYLNCVSPPAALLIQQSSSTDQFVRQMKQAVEAEWGVDLNEFLGICNGLKLNTAERGTFDFDSLIRDRLLTGEETFLEFRDAIVDKVQSIADAAAKSNVRISRSLLHNPQFCMDVGVKDHSTLTRNEYQTIAPILGHYHHFAFSKSLGLEGFATYQLPTPDVSAKNVLRNELERVASASMAGHNSVSLSWPLASISFENLWQVRLGRSDFLDYLNPVCDAAKTSDLETYREKLQSYARHVAGVVSFDFADPNPKELAAGLDGTVFADGPTSKAAVEVAKYAFTFCRDFFPNIGKELQVRWLFRKLRQVDVDNVMRDPEDA